MSLEKVPVLPPAPKPAPEPKPAKGKAHDEAPRDTFREVVETVVFVIVLVLLLKTFIAEAFVIPTGSMATTLYGYQKVVTCADCGHKFPVNCSNEVDPQDGVRRFLVGYTCPNCRFHEDWANGEGPDWSSGDRVLVAKFLYDGPFGGRPHPLDVVVFKYPESPQKDGTAMNYIKRLYGLGGDTLAIHGGNLYVARGIDYSAWLAGQRRRDDEPPPRPEDLWKKEYMYINADPAREAFQRGAFAILRKPPAQQIALRRLVYDNEHQAKSLIGKIEPRWLAEKGGGWSVNDRLSPKTFRHEGDELSFIRYRHLIPTRR